MAAYDDLALSDEAMAAGMKTFSFSAGLGLVWLRRVVWLLSAQYKIACI
jgi:hypothetical protein